MEHVELGGVEVSRLILGSNPFSGFSHQTPERDLEMKRYFTTAKIKETISEAERLGITTIFARADNHVVRLLLEYWDEGGQIRWFAQTCPEVGSNERCVVRAVKGGAKGCYIHGGVMDNFLAQNRLDEIPPAIDLIKESGLAAGVAGHNPATFEWAEENLDVDFYMCCYYNSANRDKEAEHISGMTEWFRDEDRQRMTDLIQGLSRPVVHYKIMAAGRNKPEEAFAFAARNMRPGDAACVGVFTRDRPDMLAENVRLFEQSLANERAG
jgi:hypothetical protein